MKTRLSNPPNGDLRHLRVAIACSGLGRVRRGFESFAADLFRQLVDGQGVDATLFKGGGLPGRGEFPLWTIPRGSTLWRFLPRRVDPYIVEQIAFSLPLARRLRHAPFDIIHISDCQLGSALRRLCPSPSREFRIVFANGGALSPSHYRAFDFIQQVNPIENERALKYGIESQRMCLLPHGITVSDYGNTTQEEAREALGLPVDSPVVLTVGALHSVKRLDFFFQEISSMDSRIHLLVVGDGLGEESEYVRLLARKHVGGGVTTATLPRELMPLAYSAADVYVHTSLREGFGLALLEAMASRLPIVYNDDPAMKWVVGEAGLAIDMRRRDGRVCEIITELMRDNVRRVELGKRARSRAEQRFSWRTLLPEYVHMFECASGVSPL